MTVLDRWGMTARDGRAYVARKGAIITCGKMRGRLGAHDSETRSDDPSALCDRPTRVPITQPTTGGLPQQGGATENAAGSMRRGDERGRHHGSTPAVPPGLFRSLLRLPRAVVDGFGP